jgi:hypothetical protein
LNSESKEDYHGKWLDKQAAWLQEQAGAAASPGAPPQAQPSETFKFTGQRQPAPAPARKGQPVQGAEYAMTVEAEAPVTRADSGEISTVIASKGKDQAMNRRSTYSLTALVGGVEGMDSAQRQDFNTTLHFVPERVHGGGQDPQPP